MYAGPLAAELADATPGTEEIGALATYDDCMRATTQLDKICLIRAEERTP